MAEGPRVLTGLRFEGRTFAVTGAGSGIGLATTTLLCRQGARVLAIDRCFPAPMPDSAECLIANVCDASELAELARGCSKGLDGIATFAGIEMPGRLDQVDLSSWHRVFEVNVFGTVRTIQAFLPALAQRQGAIVLCSSQMSLAGGRDCAAYAASKGAINALCRSLALDYTQQGIRVNAIAPGAIETPMMDRAFRNVNETHREASRKRHAMARFGRPEEPASAAAFLLGEEASFITGTVLPVDGGWLAA
ncbi:SDR family NAD(P)-dependent oxidoreductase [Paracoccus sp. 22332]|uniref:SDR family NAD(P)-dependent oxidoreductase n=1 Tax=Paracoccus sp. 22332 TaxID=3453913 RepID=UPI003F82E7DD